MAESHRANISSSVDDLVALRFDAAHRNGEAAQTGDSSASDDSGFFHFGGSRRTVTGLVLGPMGRLLRMLDHSGLGYWLYRYRYLASFTVIGFISILIELWLMRAVLPTTWPLPLKSTVAFCLGIVVSFLANAYFNFQVTWRHLLRTFAWFAVISTISFATNMAVVRSIYGLTGNHYELLRLVTAGALFAIGYTLHRRYTFDQARDFGLAVYACESEDPHKLYVRVGRNCDHVHVDLIDSTMGINPSPVRLANIAMARQLWRGCPLVLHIMSLRPQQWVEQTWNDVDVYLFHLESEDDLMELAFACRQRGKHVGVAWRPGNSTAALLPYLPHVDFVMVLGIREPGRSGQEICAEAIEMAATLSKQRSRYGYEVMFDGGVKASNVTDIEAKYIVAASAVLNADHPIRAAHVLRSGARYFTRNRSVA
ncbi:MAG: GtrA family protein [Pirellulales bacterium]|nr:GtrA family protein [Pirellulales bacterium]